MPVARAQLNKVTSVRIRQMVFQEAGHDARVSHPGVEPAEITARAQGGLILRRQDVQQFRQDNAFHAGGTNGTGTVFAVNTNGTGFMTLHSFTARSGSLSTNSDGAYPNDGLILSGNTLYGT